MTKPGRLDEAEWALVRRHPVIGAEIVARFAAHGDWHRLVRHHHERWDGTGHPDGLAGEAIPLGARILAVAGAFDAMTSERAYRPAMSAGAAVPALEDGASSQWDARVVAVMVDHLAKAVSRPPVRDSPAAAASISGCRPALGVVEAAGAVGPAWPT